MKTIWRQALSLFVGKLIHLITTLGYFTPSCPKNSMPNSSNSSCTVKFEDACLCLYFVGKGARQLCEKRQMRILAMNVITLRTLLPTFGIPKTLCAIFGWLLCNRHEGKYRVAKWYCLFNRGCRILGILQCFLDRGRLKRIIITIGLKQHDSY